MSKVTITVADIEKKTFFLKLDTEKKEFKLKTEFKETINLNIS